MAAAGGDMRPPTTHNNNHVSVTAVNVVAEPPRARSAPHPCANQAVQGAGLPTVMQQPSGVVDGADDEVARIDFRAAVNMRIKKKREDELMPRPMSWEGELSDGERNDKDEDRDGGIMCVDDDDDRLIVVSGEQVPENLSVNNKPPVILDSKESPIVRLKQTPMGSYSLHSTPSNSPLLSQRHPVTGVPIISHKDLIGQHKAAAAAAVAAALNVPPTPSPDSAVHSATYSVFSSPSQSPLTQRHHVSLTPNLSRNNSDASHSSCCSYSSVSVSVSPTQQFSPTHSPIQGRHLPTLHNSPLHHHPLYGSRGGAPQEEAVQFTPNNCVGGDQQLDQDECVEDKAGLLHAAHPAAAAAAQPGISRQQLINSPCPICGDKISGFHYGIFSCESCKGFFKRTVQNRKNYVCLRGAQCPVTVATRKKCPACRFDKCLQCGMKLEAIREDRTRGGRSTYQCSYSLPPSMNSHAAELRASSCDLRHAGSTSAGGISADGSASATATVKLEPPDSHPHHHYQHHHRRPGVTIAKGVPPLLQEIMDVEHLWHYSESELVRLSAEGRLESTSGTDAVRHLSTHPLLAGTALAGSTDTSPDFVAELCNIADHRLYKIVKWCKSLPLFKNISIDDQICLLINSWCELLLFSCCYRSVSTPGEIRVSRGRGIDLQRAREMGVQPCIERMLNFTDQLRRLKVDQYEYCAMKVIVLLTSDTSELREAEKVRASQEKALKALQDYTLTHYPELSSKFGELLLRIPELQRTCQVGKEMLTIKSKDGDGPSFNLLMELLRGDH